MSADILIRPRVPDDDRRLVEINRLNNPDRPPLSVEEMRHGMASQPPGAQARLMVAEIAGRVVGDIGWNRMIYIQNRDSWWSYLYVDPEYTGRGVGCRLFDEMLEDVRRHDAEKVLCAVRDDQPRAVDFVRRRGFEPTGHDIRLSRLEVATADLARSRAAAERVERSGIRIATMAEIGRDDKAFVHALHEMSDQTERDVPGSEQYAGMPFETWCEDVFDSPGSSPDTFWVALDGDKPVGLALLTVRSEGWADNHYTGVARDYRGHGIARALKLRTVEWARSQGIRWIMTGNDETNEPMLAVNVDLGYRPVAAGLEMALRLR